MKGIISFIICVISFITFFYFLDKYNGEVRVEGTVIGSTTEAKTTYKSTEVFTEYRLAVHPDNTEIYKDFDTEVSFATACKYKIGDKIIFPHINQQEVMKMPPSYAKEIWASIIMLIISGALSFYFLIDM